ncbi:MAG: tetratricopeptide repeat protein [Bacteroidales bacterium]|jgi:tetratricopeptide (TPR) repeat protein|nr:tetratricopeptide repeat protein [Bacteroidales bacterium]
MKKIVFTIALTIISLSGFAQTADEAAAINKWIDVYAQLNEAKEWQKMIDTSNLCEKEAPNWEYLDYYLGVAYFNLNNYFKAINEMTDFINKTDTILAAFMIRGDAYVHEKEYEAALLDYDKLLSANPKDVNALIAKAKVSQAQGDNAAYLADLSKVLEVEPGNVDVLTNRGSIYAMNGDFQSAVNDFTAAINAKPSAELFFNRAKANFALKTNESLTNTIDDCNKAEELGMKDKDLYQLRLVANQSVKNYPEVVKDYNNILLINGEDLNMLLGRGVAKYQMNDWKGAIEDMDLVIAKDPKNIKAYQVRATCKTKLKDTKGAQADAAKVKELQGSK